MERNEEDVQGNALHICYAMMTVGCFAVIFGVILLSNSIDYFMIVRGKPDQCMAKPYFQRTQKIKLKEIEK